MVKYLTISCLVPFWRLGDCQSFVRPYYQMFVLDTLLVPLKSLVVILYLHSKKLRKFSQETEKMYKFRLLSEANCSCFLTNFFVSFFRVNRWS